MGYGINKNRQVFTLGNYVYFVGKFTDTFTGIYRAQLHGRAAVCGFGVAWLKRGL